MEAFGPNHVGTFVEVGAFDGVSFSNTRCLTELGWSGLYIEPMPLFAEWCREYSKPYPKVKVECCACGDKEGDLVLYECGSESTTQLDTWTRQWGASESSKQHIVPCFRLETLLDKHGVTNIDVLVVDTEGTETQVLSGFDLGKHLPKLAIIELHEAQGTGPNDKGYQEPWVTQFFSNHGYRKIYFDRINTVYSR